jgi:hypothetical protein
MNERARERERERRKEILKTINDVVTGVLFSTRADVLYLFRGNYKK